ncbi:unnamed protein product [Rotaria sordida]|uniref:Uncharacterized protein n=1 Tax=Rotaria sordida TaxID=392033 RepID=A0A814QRI0_9BILA|nr:unnamed protein product [Rotaria sordida]CAF3982450.1 unnamed protein product [Rotaria sordida]
MDTSKDGESSEPVSTRQRLKLEIEKYEQKLGDESELQKSVWNKINSKEQLIKNLNEQIKNLKGEIDAHIIEESAISKSMKELKEKKEALEKQLLPNEQNK